MVEEDRYCADIILQIASVQEALRGVSRELMRNHLTHCATDAIRSGSPEKAAATYDELLQLILQASQMSTLNVLDQQAEQTQVDPVCG